MFIEREIPRGWGSEFFLMPENRIYIGLNTRYRREFETRTIYNKYCCSPWVLLLTLGEALLQTVGTGCCSVSFLICGWT